VSSIKPLPPLPRTSKEVIKRCVVHSASGQKKKKLRGGLHSSLHLYKTKKTQKVGPKDEVPKGRKRRIKRKEGTRPEGPSCNSNIQTFEQQTEKGKPKRKYAAKEKKNRSHALPSTSRKTSRDRKGRTMGGRTKQFTTKTRTQAKHGRIISHKTGSRQKDKATRHKKKPVRWRTQNPS